MTRVPTSLLVAGALAAVVLDLAVAGAAAIADGSAPATDAPDDLPLAVRGLSTPIQGTVDGIDVRSDVDDDGTFALLLTNPGPARRTAKLTLHLEHLSGSGVGRMGPMRMPVLTEELLAEIPAGATHRHRLEAVHLAPTAPPAAPADILVLGSAFPSTWSATQLYVASASGSDEFAMIETGGELDLSRLAVSPERLASLP